MANVQAGFDSYAAFALAGWQPPMVSADRDRSAELLADPTTWALIALADGAPAGHVGFLPGSRPIRGARLTAHAPSSRASLIFGSCSYCPSGGVVAWRRGWSAAEEEWNDELALMLTEYRLALD